MSNFWDFSVWGTFNLIAAKIMTDFFPAAGVLLPFGYGQGTGQALNYGNIYEMDYDLWMERASG